MRGRRVLSKRTHAVPALPAIVLQGCAHRGGVTYTRGLKERRKAYKTIPFTVAHGFIGSGRSHDLGLYA